MIVLLIFLFCLSGMTARTMLAALDNNKNVGRQQATVQSGTKKGEPRFNVVCPKGRKGWIARPVFEKKSYSYVEHLMQDVLKLCAEGTEERMPVRQQAPRIAPGEKPEKEEVVRTHRSRFPK